MIVDVVKYLIWGAKGEVDRFFHLAQEMGFLEFITISGKKQIEVPITVQNLSAALKILRKLSPQEMYKTGGDLTFAMQIAERVLELKEDLEKLGDEKRLLEAEVSRVAPFGDFSMDDIAFIEREGGRKVQFFCRKTARREGSQLTDDVFYVGTEYDLDYFIAINPETVSYPGMIEMRIDTAVGELENRLSFVQDAIHRFEGELKEYVGHIDFLHEMLVDELNKHHLTAAKKEVSSPLSPSLFAIEAWVPANKTHSLFALIDGMAIDAEELVVEKHEKTPTCLENHGGALIGEDLIKQYDVPSTSDKDPSIWVLGFFALFFAIIVADAGYGLIFLAVALYLKFKFPKMTGEKKRMLNLLFILSSACVVWGVLTASYFGIRVVPGTFFSKLAPLHYLALKKADYHFIRQDDVYTMWKAKFPAVQETVGSQFLMQAKTDHSYPMLQEFSSNILIEIALVIAIVHLSVAFLRYARRHIAGLGWIAFMIGGYLYFPSFLRATSMIHFLGWITPEKASLIGGQLLIVGLCFAFLAALIQKGKKGLGEISHLVQVFADVLSYLRLYALGLAGAIMAETFNEEGSGLGLVLGALVIICGHSINIMLAAMGGVIHGLRLNFLEWYHYCFEGGGRLFRPLRRIKK
ncbi:MAG: V-type ATP synthase subunit I [Verrucomicrobia bacterium]|nr:V-type ATP synthase subunit I [Verrucomicrobiota bacterium]